MVVSQVFGPTHLSSLSREKARCSPSRRLSRSQSRGGLKVKAFIAAKGSEEAVRSRKVLKVIEYIYNKSDAMAAAQTPNGATRVG